MINKIGLKVKDWATRRVLAVACLAVISLLLVPWLRAMLDEAEGNTLIEPTSIENLFPGEKNEKRKGM